MTPHRRRVLVGVALLLVFAVGPFVNWAARTWTDYLWYADLGQAQVFVTRIVAQLAVGATFAAVTFVLLFVNLRVARSMAPRAVTARVPDTLPEQIVVLIERLRQQSGPVIDRIVLAGSLVFAFLSGLAMAAQWETFRLWLARVDFGRPDPQFGRDVGFFLFSLPAHEAVLSWLTGVLIVTVLATLAVHMVDGAIRPWERLRGFAPHVKAHLSVLLGALVLTRAYGYWLAIWGLNYSPRGQVTGASYTDVTAQLPAYRALVAVSVITAAALLFNIRLRGWRLPAIALGGWIAISVLVGGVWPQLVQQFRVNPNESSLEAPFIARNIETTRFAFDLSGMTGRTFPGTDDLTASDVSDNELTLSNVRLWDPSIVQQSYSQLQAIRSYYEFPDVDVDRYEIDGARRQVLIAARELNTSALDPKAQNWVNTHLVYTHGFGIVMSPVATSDTRGLPEFFIGDIPPRVSSALATGTAAASLKIDEPRIYFGEETNGYVIVGTGKDEFDYPQGEQNTYYRYEGSTGPRIGAFPQRLAWAVRLGSTQVLFSNYVNAESRVLVDRRVLDRVNKLAPWLILEDDPYVAIVDGRLLWIVDGYTHSSRFPYSERLESGTNYLRNSVKTTVDAFTGETTLYAFDEEDPVLKAWRNVFPNLITDGNEIPDGVRAHFRYPEGLFSAQAEMYRTYHMTDVNVFYNKEDQWQIPGERDGEPMAPYFVLLNLPGTDAQHFYVIQPYTPRNRDNMNGWIAASSDPENYGERTVYLFPKDRVVLGPEQVSARIQQDPLISPQLTLWSQGGSDALFGNMQVIPINDSVIYVQPLFLQAERTAIPELTRVIIAYADKVAMERTLTDALLSIFGAKGGDAPVTPSTVATAAEAQRLYGEAVSAQRAGDWARYGELIEELGRALEDLASQSATQAP